MSYFPAWSEALDCEYWDFLEENFYFLQDNFYISLEDQTLEAIEVSFYEADGFHSTYVRRPLTFRLPLFRVLR